jgi:hypothetical protein
MRVIGYFSAMRVAARKTSSVTSDRIRVIRRARCATPVFRPTASLHRSVYVELKRTKTTARRFISKTKIAVSTANTSACSGGRKWEALVIVASHHFSRCFKFRATIIAFDFAGIDHFFLSGSGPSECWWCGTQRDNVYRRIAARNTSFSYSSTPRVTGPFDIRFSSQHVPTMKVSRSSMWNNLSRNTQWDVAFFR